MNTPDELRRIQLLERRMLERDSGIGVGMNGNSRGKMGSNSNSVDFTFGNGHSQSHNEQMLVEQQVAPSAAERNVASPSNSRNGSDSSVENKKNAAPSSSSSSASKGRRKVGTTESGSKGARSGSKRAQGSEDVIAFSATFSPVAGMGVGSGSNHDDSISRISPLKASALATPLLTSKSSAAKANRKNASADATVESELDGPSSGDKRKGGPDSTGKDKALGGRKDINLVLKHVDLPLPVAADGIGAAAAAAAEDGVEMLAQSGHNSSEPHVKQARTGSAVFGGSAGASAGAGGASSSSLAHNAAAAHTNTGSLSVTVPIEMGSQDGASHSHDIISVTTDREGSRGTAAGASANKRTIQAYFAPQGGEAVAASRGFFGSSSSGSSAAAAAAAAVSTGSSGFGYKEKGDDTDLPLSPLPSHHDAAAAEATAQSSSTSAATGAKGGRGKKDMPPPTLSRADSSAAAAAATSDKDVRKQLEVLRANKERVDNKVFRLEDDLKSAQTKQTLLEERNIKMIRQLEGVQREMAQQDARRKRDRLALDCVRLGKIATVRTSATSYGEVWEEGYALKELNQRSAHLVETRDELTRRKNDLKSLKSRAKAKLARELKNDQSGGGGLGASDDDCDVDFVAETEAIGSHMRQLAKDETALVEERRVLETEKAAHLKELKRCQSEDKSRFFKTLPCLKDNRYLLVSMLGRGGFSEVWKALDLMELREVAIKIHQLNPVWNEERKNAYIRHVTREYTIHRDMRHPRVVQLFDVFEIDNNSFATVLELCRGIDLDEKLKRCRIVPEKDARTILLQIVSGLRYLNIPSAEGDDEVVHAHGLGGAVAGTTQRRMAIIHYDLKPANILFDEMGDAKITDFGLSKIIDDSNDDESLELTSQGAGTYWYLPPECFAKADANGSGPRVSSKVDVWSVGVIFYQMLYGKRPFGEGKSQELVLREGLILNAHQVEFPSNGPKISEEAKDFIRTCLTHSKERRPDVHAMCMHTYLSSKTVIK